MRVPTVVSEPYRPRVPMIRSDADAEESAD